MKLNLLLRHIRHADHVAPLYPRKLALSSPTRGGRSMNIVRSRIKDKEFLVLDRDRHFEEILLRASSPVQLMSSI
jgi:hypothetical protein